MKKFRILDNTGKCYGEYAYDSKSFGQAKRKALNLEKKGYNVIIAEYDGETFPYYYATTWANGWRKFSSDLLDLSRYEAILPADCLLNS